MGTKSRIDEVPWELVCGVDDQFLQLSIDPSSSSEEELLQVNENQLSVEYNMGRKNKKKKTRSVKDSDSDYEVVPAQRVVCMDEENLFLNENHFQLSTQFSNSSTENDSDIEIVTKPLIEITTPSKVHNKENNVKNEKAKINKKAKRDTLKKAEKKEPIEKKQKSISNPTTSLYSQILQKNITEPKELINEESEAYSEDFYIDNYQAVNVLSESFPDIKSSFDIVFSENADGLIEVNTDKSIVRSNKSLDPIDELDEFCFERLFKPRNHVTCRSENYDSSIDDDDGDVAIVSLKTSTLIMLFCLTVIVSMGVGNGCGSIFIEKQNSSTKNPKMEETVPMDDTYTNVLIYSNGKVRKLSISEALLGKKNHEALIGLVESYNDLETKYRDLIKKYGMLEENYHNEKSLALQLKRDQIKHENELLQKTEEEESLESDESNEHGDLWNKIRESWKNQQLKNVKKSHLHAKRNRFRKIFNIGNIVNSKPPPPKVENAQNENNNFCPDEDFQNFQNRWKKVDGKQNEKVMEENSSDDISPDDITENTDTTNNVVNMAPEPPKKKCTVKRYGKYKTVYNCDRMRMLEVADEDFPRDYAGTAETDLDENLTECALCDHQSEAITVEIIGKKIRVVSPFSENETDLTDDSDPFDFVRKNLDHIQDHQGNETVENVSYNKESHKQTEEEKELCKRERYGAYQTVYSCPNGKILESKDPGFILSPWQDGCFACTVDGIFVEVVNNSIRVISKYEGENLTQSIDKDPFDFIRKDLMKNRTAKNVKREEREEISKQKESEKNEQIAWMKNRLAKVELEFDMYKWRVGSKLLDKISELQFQISDLLEERREEHKEFKLQKKKFVSKMKIIKRKLIAEKEELENEKNRHEAMLQSEKEKFSKWKLKEQKKLKYDSKQFEANVEKRNEKFKMKIKKAKELLNKNLKAKYAKISQMKSEYVRSNKKAKDTVRMFERRNRRLASQLNSLRVLYKSTESKLFHYERISDSEFTLNSHDAEITKPTSNDEALRKVVNKYKKKHKECQWRIPMTSCACDSFPGKPTPPTNLRNPSTLPLAEYSVPLKPSPSRKQNGNNKTESTDNNPNEKLSYLYNTEERRLVNSYDVDWHDKLMKSRRHVREEENMQYEGPKMNWFMRYMHERENQRDESDESDKQKKANTNENLYDHMKPSFTKFKKYKNKLKRKWNNLMSNIKDKWYDMYHHGNNHHFDDLDEYEANNFDDDFYHREKYYTDENDDIIMN